MRKFKVMKINETIISGNSMKIVIRTLGIEKNKLLGLRKATGELTSSRNKIVKVIERFYVELYHSDL